ncbi:uncharacterized protein B0H18DRAFT_1129102 [Fomitopsis serialis]|uniref:uncharacterized protein n=1 Tax=Fomitopsis serialis TaxID=139415 RepID=UPI002008643E|nr:uncharacterized protein B0H18DRAFT_1129102 [Neoantrodia serialis]KAH9911117.1 hypothetical protein B0H18DRAFT_1129102 [Neoantrodia serialis]
MSPDGKLKTGDSLLSEFLSDVQTIRYSELASSTIIIFDHLLTLDQEYNLIWTAPWSIGKWLFLFNRYYTLLTVIFNNFGGNAPIRHENPSLMVTMVLSCLNWYRWQGWTGVTSFIIAELILLLRLYALYFLNKRALVFMACTSLVAFAASAGIMGSLLAKITATAHPFPTHPTPYCAASGLSASAYAFWIPMLISECVLCALAVSRFVHMHHTRAGATLFQNGRRLVVALIRDSVWYFVVMFATYLANTIVFVVGTATEIEIPIGFSVAFACVLANRLCLNARGMVRRERSGSSSDSTSESYMTPEYVSSPRAILQRPYDSVEDWEEGAYENEEGDLDYGYGGSGYDGQSSRRHIMSDTTPTRSPVTAEVEGGERLDAIQMRELRRMRSTRERGYGLGARWAEGLRAGRGKREGIGEESHAEREGVGLATI